MKQMDVRDSTLRMCRVNLWYFEMKKFFVKIHVINCTKIPYLNIREENKAGA